LGRGVVARRATDVEGSEIATARKTGRTGGTQSARYKNFLVGKMVGWLERRMGSDIVGTVGCVFTARVDHPRLAEFAGHMFRDPP